MSAYDIDSSSSAAVYQMCYAGFWPRLGAILLDLLIMLPLMGLFGWGLSRYRLFQVFYFVPGFLFSVLRAN